MNEEFVSERVAAKYLTVSAVHLRNLRRAGEVPHLRLGHRVLYHVPTLRDWALARMRGKAAPDGPARKE